MNRVQRSLEPDPSAPLIDVVDPAADSPRDDASGPTCFDEIDMPFVECCSQTGTTCVPTDC